MKWSILLATIPTRYPSPAGDLLKYLSMLTEDQPIEILGLLDNFVRSVGEKRNMLLQMARGEYVSFIDDDDLVKPRYVSAVMEALKHGPDVVTWWQETHHIRRNYLEMCDYSLAFDYQVAKMSMNFGLWKGKPAHTHCWRAEIAKKCRFPDEDCGEDVAWVKQACALAKTEVRIPEVLTVYQFDESKTETKGDGWRMKQLNKLYDRAIS